MDAQGVADILKRGFQQTGAAGFAAIFPDLLVAAKGEAHLPRGFRLGHARLPALLHLVFEMEAQFLIQLSFHGLAAEHRTKTKA